MCKTDSPLEVALQHRELNPVLCDNLEGGTGKVVVPHSRTLARKIPWTEEPGTLQSMGSHRVGHDWNDLAAATAEGGMGWGVGGGRFKKTYIYLWLIHIVVWQKPTQYCKAIILQLNNKFFQKKKKCIMEARETDSESQRRNPITCPKYMEW